MFFSGTLSNFHWFGICTRELLWSCDGNMLFSKKYLFPYGRAAPCIPDDGPDIFIPFSFFSMSFLVCGSLLKMHLEVPAYALLALILAGTRVSLTYLFLGCEWWVLEQCVLWHSQRDPLPQRPNERVGDTQSSQEDGSEGTLAMQACSPELESPALSGVAARAVTSASRMRACIR